MAHINSFPDKAQQDYINEVLDLRTMVTKALSGDMVYKVTPATAAPTTTALAANDVVYTVKVRLENAAGELHDWYNGVVLLAIADTDDGDGVTATIDPAAGEHKMTNGELSVTVTMSKAAWAQGKKATLTVKAPATASTGICGVAVADATFVATVA